MSKCLLHSPQKPHSPVRPIYYIPEISLVLYHWNDRATARWPYIPCTLTPTQLLGQSERQVCSTITFIWVASPKAHSRAEIGTWHGTLDGTWRCFDVASLEWKWGVWVLWLLAVTVIWWPLKMTGMWLAFLFPSNIQSLLVMVHYTALACAVPMKTY